MALTEEQVAELRSRPVGETGNRLSAAIDLHRETQVAVADALGFSQQYVSDVARGRWQSISLPNGRRFAEHFGCAIEDLFPARDAVARAS